MKKVDFLFEYEIKQRELDSVCLIASYLKKKGYTVAVVNSWQAMYEDFPRYNAEVMIVSACYNDNVYNSFCGLAKKHQKVVNLQWEQVRQKSMYEPHDRLFIDYQGKGLITRHVCWGEGEKRWLNDFWRIDPFYTNISGFTALDFYRPEFKHLLIPRETLFSQYGIDPSKKTLLFVSSFSLVDIPDTEVFDDDNPRETFIDVSRKSQKILLEWFARLLVEYPDIQLIYRYHPAEKNNTVINELCRKFPNFFAISEYPIRHWLAACDKLLNWWSTSLIEMYCSGKETYILRPINIPSKSEIVLFEGARFVHTYDEWISTMEHYPGFPVPQESILEWYSIIERPAYQRLGDWLIETYHSADYKSPPAENITHHSLFVSNLACIVKSVVVRLRLTALVKKFFPGSNVFLRFQKIEEDVAHQKEKRDKNGYMYEKYRQNALKPKEAENLIDTYQALCADGRGL